MKIRNVVKKYDKMIFWLNKIYQWVWLRNVIPFSKLRKKVKNKKYSLIKILNFQFKDLNKVFLNYT